MEATRSHPFATVSESGQLCAFNVQFNYQAYGNGKATLEPRPFLRIPIAFCSALLFLSSKMQQFSMTEHSSTANGLSLRFILYIFRFIDGFLVTMTLKREAANNCLSF